MLVNLGGARAFSREKKEKGDELCVTPSAPLLKFSIFVRYSFVQTDKVRAAHPLY
jgi:hypothetical protein